MSHWVNIRAVQIKYPGRISSYVCRSYGAWMVVWFYVSINMPLLWSSNPAQDAGLELDQRVLFRAARVAAPCAFKMSKLQSGVNAALLWLRPGRAALYRGFAIRRGAASSKRFRVAPRLAECNSAIQRIANLRYEAQRRSALNRYGS